MRRTVLLIMTALLAASAAGCAPPPVAPKALSDLTLFLYREWPDTATEPLESAVTNLHDFLKPLNDAGELTGELKKRSWTPAPPQKTDLVGITWPMDRDPQNCLSSSVAWKSPWPITDHARLQTEVNQLPAEPSATVYVRSFLDPAMPTCFINQACSVLNTSNNVTRSNVLLSVNMTLFKSMRWVHLKASGLDRWAVVSRSWIEKSAEGANSSTAILQSYSLDVWLSISDTETWRYQTVFSENKLAIAADNASQEYFVAQGTDQALQAGDAAIKKLYH